MIGSTSVRPKGPLALLALLAQWVSTISHLGECKVLVKACRIPPRYEIPWLLRNLIREIPGLAIVQDAVRLDAVDAFAIDRCFTFGASRGRGLPDSVKHCEEKPRQLESMIKTRRTQGIGQGAFRTNQRSHPLGWMMRHWLSQQRWRSKVELRNRVTGVRQKPSHIVSTSPGSPTSSTAASILSAFRGICCVLAIEDPSSPPNFGGGATWLPFLLGTKSCS